VAQIGYDMVAVSNYPEPEKIHSIIDRHGTAAWPFAGSTLLRHHFHEVPLLSLAWGVGQIGLPFSESGTIKIFGFSLPLQADATIVASVRWAGTFRLKVEEIAPTDDAAAHQSAALTTLVTMARIFTSPLPDNTANTGLKEILKTAEVTQKHNRVVVTASFSPSLVGEMASEQNSPPASSAVPAASK
jgi:hypothetical protein